MLYLIRLDLRQPDGISRSKFQELWRRGIATETRPGGSGIFRSFKVVGRWTIFAVAEFPDNHSLDEALMRLPIFEDLGCAVEIEVYPVWPFEELDAPEEAPDEPAEEPELPEEADLTSGDTYDSGGTLREETATVEDLPDPDALREDPPATAKPEAPPGGLVSLQSADEPDSDEVFEVDKARIGLGRGPENRVVVDDPGTSYRHALIRREGDAYWIDDLGSRNGTWVNDQQVTDRHALKDGDKIRVGNARFVFSVVADEVTWTDTPPARPEEDLSVSMPRGIGALEEEQAEPGQPEEAGQVTEAIQVLETQGRAPAGSERDETEDPPAADNTAQLEPDREEPPIFVSTRREAADPARAQPSAASDPPHAPPEAPEEEASPVEVGSAGGDRYTRSRLLGSGEIAEVDLARDRELDRDVAFKVLKKQYVDDEQFVERFEREARNAASLDHPNVVAVHDWGRTEDGSYYMAMEYVPGGTLEERLQEEGALPATTAAGLALRVARALSYAHERGMIHRDVKPRNVLLTGAGEAKVTDFGIARAAAASTMTQEGAVLGTPHYVSPEQALGQPASPKSDLYSLGVVFYETLTGELPHDAKTPVEIIMKHVGGHLRPPREIDREIPEELNAVVVRLLARNPADRYRDANELIEVLEQVLGNAAEDPGVSKPRQPGDEEEPTRPDEGSITGAIRGLDAPSQGRAQGQAQRRAQGQAQGRGPAEEGDSSAEGARADETGQEPTQIEGEGSVTGMIRSLDAGGPEQPAEGQVTGMIRSLDSPGEPSAARVLLRIVAGPASGQTFEVGRTGATMGRSPDNPIRMSDERLSRRHARIQFKDGVYWLADLGSSNGTYVNQHRLSAPHQLRSGDVIGLGRTRLSVELETAG